MANKLADWFVLLGLSPTNQPTTLVFPESTTKLEPPGERFAERSGEPSSRCPQRVSTFMPCLCYRLYTLPRLLPAGPGPYSVCWWWTTCGTSRDLGSALAWPITNPCLCLCKVIFCTFCVYTLDTDTNKQANSSQRDSKPFSICSITAHRVESVVRGKKIRLLVETSICVSFWWAVKGLIFLVEHKI